MLNAVHALSHQEAYDMDDDDFDPRPTPLPIQFEPDVDLDEEFAEMLRNDALGG